MGIRKMSLATVMSIIFALLIVGLAVPQPTVFAQGVIITPNPASRLEADIRTVVEGAHHVTKTSPAIDGPLTVSTLVTFDHNWVSQGTSEIWLAGVARDGSERPEIGLVWSEEASGWFALWKIQLHTGYGAPVELVTLTPSKGTTYHSLLSYDPATGAVSWRITERDTGSLVASGGRQVEAAAGPYYAAAGVVVGGSGPSAQASQVRVASVEAYGQYVPVASRVQLLSEGDGRIPRVKFSQTDNVLVRIQSPGGTAAGEYFLRFEDWDTGQVHELGPVYSDEVETVFPIALSDLEAGQTTLEMAYIEGGHIWLTETVQLSIGRLTAYYDPVHVSLAQNQVETTVRIEADGLLENFPVDIYATLSRLIWHETDQTYYSEGNSVVPVFNGSLTIDQQVTEIPLAVDIPEPEAPGLWEIVFNTDRSLSIDTEEFRTSHIFTNYAPALADNHEYPFTVVVLPDTQYYARDYPDIFTRQTEWIVANAEEMNIRLMLHLGDITQTNLHVEWERSNRSLSLLDGVVPYVLSIGNHDMVSPGGVKDRTSSFFNQYFPVNRYEHLPSFGGVFEAASHENSYYTFELGGEKYLVVSLEFGPRDEVLDWANNVVEAHEDHKVIVITHTYTSSHGSRVTPSTTSASPQVYPIGQDPTQSVNDGEQMWDKFVRKHPNMWMVLSGHIATSTMRSQTAVGDHGNIVYEILADFQGEPNGGDGWLVLMEFIDENTVVFRTYSPYWGRYETLKSVRGFTNTFVIDLQRGWILPR